MRSASLDRRVRAEAQALSREAHAELLRKGHLRGRAGDLEAAVRAVDTALAAGDHQGVRRGLPMLDALVDELIKHPAKSTTRDYVESIGAAILIALALRAMVLEAFKIPSSSMYPTLEINDHIFVNKFLYGVHIPFTAWKLGEWRQPRRGEVIVFMQPCEPDRDYIKRVVATEGQSVEVRCNVVYVDGQAVEHELIRGETCSYDDYDESNGRWYHKGCSEYAERALGHEYRTFQDPDRPLRDDRLAKEGSLASADSKDFPRLDGARTPPSCTTQPDAEPFAAPNQLQGKLVTTKQVAGPCEQQLHYVVPPGHVFVMGDNRANSNDSRYWGSVPVENIRGKALFIWMSYRHWGWQFWSGIRYDRIGNFVK
jgi:signal peptidase I